LCGTPFFFSFLNNNKFWWLFGGVNHKRDQAAGGDGAATRLERERYGNRGIDNFPPLLAQSIAPAGDQTLCCSVVAVNGVEADPTIREELGRNVERERRGEDLRCKGMQV
jgi:hypothetical protein